MESADIKVQFIVGNASIPIKLETLKLFKYIENMICDMNIDIDSTQDIKIPNITDAMGKPINIINSELQLFIDLFEISINPLIDESDLYDEFATTLNKERLYKFLMLINLLDNQTFLNHLAKYTANLCLTKRIVL
jgi:hypothetical protein